MAAAEKRLSDHGKAADAETSLARPTMCLAHSPSPDMHLQGFLASGTSWSPQVTPSCILPFTTLRGKLPDDVLKFLQASPEWLRTKNEWDALKHAGDRLMGFEKEQPAVEMYAHCHSQDSPMEESQQRLYGQDACRPAPIRIMAFRHAMMLINGSRLRALEEEIVQAMAFRSDEDIAILGHSGVGLSLCRSAFSIATMQLRWGERGGMHMDRHVDGGPSILHMSLSLFGWRRLNCEVLGQKRADGSYAVQVISDDLGPGDVYVSSPACCYHSVDYEEQGLEAACQPPNTLVIHLRSDILRLRHGPRVFHKSNLLMSEVIAPTVAKFLAKHPLQLPSLADVMFVMRKWEPP
jgi:hypothetical protein